MRFAVLNDSSAKKKSAIGNRQSAIVVTHVFLVRHGQSRGNAEGRFGGHTDTPLSPRGRKQAQAAAETFAKEKLTAIYASDLARSLETAQPLARLTKLTGGSGR